MKTIFAIIGLLNNAVKGVAFLFDPIDPNGDDVSKNVYGWASPHMMNEWHRFSLPKADILHLGSNIWVEWVEQRGGDKMALRRGVKMMSALWLLSAIGAFALGALVL